MDKKHSGHIQWAQDTGEWNYNDAYGYYKSVTLAFKMYRLTHAVSPRSGSNNFVSCSDDGAYTGRLIGAFTWYGYKSNSTQSSPAGQIIRSSSHGTCILIGYV